MFIPESFVFYLKAYFNNHKLTREKVQDNVEFHALEYLEYLSVSDTVVGLGIINYGFSIFSRKPFYPYAIKEALIQTDRVKWFDSRVNEMKIVYRLISYWTFIKLRCILFRKKGENGL